MRRFKFHCRRIFVPRRTHKHQHSWRHHTVFIASFAFSLVEHIIISAVKCEAKWQVINKIIWLSGDLCVAYLQTWLRSSVLYPQKPRCFSDYPLSPSESQMKVREKLIFHAQHNKLTSWARARLWGVFDFLTLKARPFSTHQYPPVSLTCLRWHFG